MATDRTFARRVAHTPIREDGSVHSEHKLLCDFKDRLRRFWLQKIQSETSWCQLCRWRSDVSAEPTAARNIHADVTAEKN